ncbi:LysR family transcriptional regulator [Acinetobacter sp. ANC 4282]|uniref:LysR family transcriptional regulator n=1 Tax=Acinetobacter terrae TaxID=2731247 RepID=A0A4R0EKZ6_9GAMM|nr:LysR family transcriptional regulator [Acinetobacter terrae]NNH16949.1 LysR family transcriptional regulator [Acinetobacter terrae]OTG75276.1 LysR family transcriptional regulator [Acinetobacter terrae]TCB57841.1 LysR family transcriptional regulator [Acinetobacter terrae]
MKVDWDHLRFFLVLARAKTLTNAARLIGVEHSTVARRIQALEQTLGIQLFKREATGYELTSEGLALVPRVEQMEQSFIQIDKPLNPLHGRVRIGAPEGFGTAFLARLLAEFSQHYPALTIDLIPVPKAIKLSHREADIVISIDRPKSGPYIITRLSNYCLKLYGSKNYLLQNPKINRVEDLAQHRFVDYIDDLVYSSALYSLERLPLQVSACFRSNSILAQQIAVSAGAGLAILPRFLVNDKTELEEVLSDQVSFTHTFWMLTLVDLQHEPRIKLVWDFLRKQADVQQELLMGK